MMTAMPHPLDEPAGLSKYTNGWLLSRLRRMRTERPYAAHIIRELNTRDGEDKMSLNEIAEKTGHPRATVQRWAKEAEDQT
jgi:hypothetical protein